MFGATVVVLRKGDEFVGLDDRAKRAGDYVDVVAAGERVAIYAQNVPQFVIAQLGTWKAGGIAVQFKTRADEVRIDGTRLHADGGASMTALAKRCAREGLAGFDWAISIPGSFGGAIWANASRMRRRR